MRPIASTRSGPAFVRPPSNGDGEASDTAAPASRSLVILDEPVRRVEAPTYYYQRPSAPFLAHLIATTQRVPQTRFRRQAEPHEATQHYTVARFAAAGRLVCWKI